MVLCILGRGKVGIAYWLLVFQIVVHWVGSFPQHHWNQRCHHPPSHVTFRPTMLQDLRPSEYIIKFTNNHKCMLHASLLPCSSCVIDSTYPVLGGSPLASDTRQPCPRSTNTYVNRPHTSAAMKRMEFAWQKSDKVSSFLSERLFVDTTTCS